MVRLSFRSLLTTTLAAVLGACGGFAGGGSISSIPAPTASATATVPPSPTSLPSPIPLPSPPLPTVAAPRAVLYISNLAKSGTMLFPLDAETLDDLAGGTPIDRGSRFATLSDDGATLITFDYARSPDVRLAPEEITIVVRDRAAGAERGRFHPPANVLFARFSQDGTRLVVRSYPDNNRPVDWYVLDATSGRVLTMVRGEPAGDDVPRYAIDADARRLYLLVVPGSPADSAPRPVHLIAYDLMTGSEVGRLELPDVLAGSWQTGRTVGSEPVTAALEPGIALAPDGRRLAIAHADAAFVTLVDTERLAIARVVTLTRPAGLFAWFGFAPPAAAAKGLGETSLRRAVFALDGRRLFLWGFESKVDAGGQETYRSIGLKLVDLERGADVLTAEALTGKSISWLLPAPAGQSIYVFGPKDGERDTRILEEDTPYLLRRLDAVTLNSQAEREFSGYQSGRIIRDRR